MVLPLFLNDVGGGEVALIVLFILIFFGSKSIPGIAKTMGSTMRQIKDATQEVQNEIKKSTGDMKKDFDLQKMVDETVSDVKKPLDEEKAALDQAFDYTPPTAFSQPFGMNKPAIPSVPLDQISEEDGELIEKDKA